MQGELFGVFTRWQIGDDLVAGNVKNLNGVGVTGANVQLRIILAERDAARTLTDLDRIDYFQAVHIDHRQAVVFFIGDIQAGGMTGAVECQ